MSTRPPYCIEEYTDGELNAAIVRIKHRIQDLNNQDHAVSGLINKAYDNLDNHQREETKRRKAAK